MRTSSEPSDKTEYAETTTQESRRGGYFVEAVCLETLDLLMSQTVYPLDRVDRVHTIAT